MCGECGGAVKAAAHSPGGPRYNCAIHEACRSTKNHPLRFDPGWYGHRFRRRRQRSRALAILGGNVSPLVLFVEEGHEGFWRRSVPPSSKEELTSGCDRRRPCPPLPPRGPQRLERRPEVPG